VGVSIDSQVSDSHVFLVMVMCNAHECWLIQSFRRSRMSEPKNVLLAEQVRFRRSSKKSLAVINYIGQWYRNDASCGLAAVSWLDFGQCILPVLGTFLWWPPESDLLAQAARFLAPTFSIVELSSKLSLSKIIHGPSKSYRLMLFGWEYKAIALILLKHLNFLGLDR